MCEFGDALGGHDRARLEEYFVGTGFGPVASLVFGAGKLGHEAGGLRPPLASPAPTSLACPHQPRLPPSASPASMLRSRASPGSDARHWSPDVILGFAEYALSFPIYSCLSFSLSLLFRQSLLYDSQFNISIRTRLISTYLEEVDRRRAGCWDSIHQLFNSQP